MRPSPSACCSGSGCSASGGRLAADERRSNRSARPAMAPLQDELTQAGHERQSRQPPIGRCCVARLLVFALVQASTCVVPVALCFGVMAAYAAGRARADAGSRQAHLRDLWPEVVDNIASAVRAGLALPEALSQLAIRGPEELRPRSPRSGRTTARRAGSTTASTGSRTGWPTRSATASGRVAADRPRGGGSDLGRLLRTLSTFLREDARTRAELETRQGWTVNAARLASAAPWIVLALLSFQRRLAAGLQHPAGVLVLLIGGSGVRRRVPADGPDRPAAAGRAGPPMSLADVPGVGLELGRRAGGRGGRARPCARVRAAGVSAAGG